MFMISLHSSNQSHKESCYSQFHNWRGFSTIEKKRFVEVETGIKDDGHKANVLRLFEVLQEVHSDSEDVALGKY